LLQVTSGWVALFPIYSGNGIEVQMPHYVAIVEDAGPGTAVGVWFPDLPGCFSAGDDIDDAMRNAEEALALYAESRAKEGQALPSPRTISALRGDPEVASDLHKHTVALMSVALIALPAAAVNAAE
jgi:predicted RNase H-like HicB family nuclease